MRGYWRTQQLIILGSYGIWHKLKRWKSSITGCLMSWPQIKIIVIMTCHLFLFFATTWTISQLDCEVWWKVVCIWQPAMTSSVAERRSSKALPKAKFAPKKEVMVTVWWSADDLIPYNFLNPSETIISENYAQQIDEMLWKLQHLQQALLNRTGSVLLHDSGRPHITQPMLQKLNRLGYKVLPHLPYSSDLSSTNDHFFKHFDNFLQGKHFHNQQEAENAFQEFVESWSMAFYATGMSKFISYCQKCVDCHSSYFD